MSAHSQEYYRYVRRSRTWRVDEGEEARRSHDTHRYTGETDPVCDHNRVCTESSSDLFVRSLRLISVNGHVLESEQYLGLRK
jgi:hypothetical protein